MKLQTLTLDGTEYVVLPRTTYDQLLAKRPAKARNPSVQEAGDLAEADRRRKAGATQSYTALRKKLGLR